MESGTAERRQGFLAGRLNRRRAARGEAFIRSYSMPAHVERELRREFPHFTAGHLALVDQGLREWFICCAWRGRKVLGMPSRAVDTAWHAFILDSAAYIDFCDRAFGTYLHHQPEAVMDTPMLGALGDTVRAWDRSKTGRDFESTLWNLDSRLGVGESLGVGEKDIARIRGVVPGASIREMAALSPVAATTGFIAVGIDGGGPGESGGDGAFDGIDGLFGGEISGGGGGGGGCGGGGGGCGGGGG